MTHKLPVSVTLRALEGAPDVGFAYINHSNRIVDCTHTFATLVGRDKSDIIGESVTAITHPESQHEIKERFRALLRGQGVSCRKAYVTPDGEKVWAMLNSVPVIDTEENAAGILSVIYLLNKEHEAMVELAELEEHQRVSDKRFREFEEETRDQLATVLRLLTGRSEVNVMNHSNSADRGSTISNVTNQSVVVWAVVAVAGLIVAVLVTLILSGSLAINHHGGGKGTLEIDKQTSRESE